MKEKTIIHVDMDAFYASIEQLDQPQLKGKCVIVGGSRTRGVVSAASYQARRFGVHSAMPIVQAIRLCPEAVVLPVRMDRYAEVSRAVHEIFFNYTDLVEPISVDEAFLDITGSAALFGGPEQTAKAIKAEIKEKTGLTASVGIGPNKFLAKLASDMEKPDGLVIIPREKAMDVLEPMDIGAIWGVGKVLKEKFNHHGIFTIGDLRQMDMKYLRQTAGNFAEALWQMARGIDDRPIETQRQRKSISSEHTFETNTADKEILLSVLMAQVEEVSGKLRKHGFTAKTVTLKFRYGSFRTITRSDQLEEPSNTTAIIWAKAREMFESWFSKEAGPLRLLGFGATGLKKAESGQGLLFEDENQRKHKRIDNAVDEIRRKFGDDAIGRRF